MILQKLSDEQKNAIMSDNNILLTAIPGSGKTRTLTNKVLKEIQEDKNGMIIAITYTRRAANEIKERIQDILGEIPKKVWVGTIHSFCLEFVIRKYGSFSETLSCPFSIIGDQDREKLLQYLQEKYNIKNIKNVDMTLNTEGKPNSVNYKEFVTEYYDLLLDNNMVDFNYILFETYKMLHENTRIRKNLSKLIRVICIDEYQDTQELQYQILGLLTKNSTDKTIFIVGDVNQAIYIGIGGVVKNKEELEEIFEREFEEQTLTGCYRSNQQIIDFYKKFMCKENEIISKNSEYINPLIQVNNSITKESLAPQIAHIINDLIENEKIRPEEICIIAPQWNLLYDFSNKIRELLPDIPFDAPGIIPLKKDEENIIYKISEILLSNFSFYNKNYLERLANEILKQFQDEYSINLNINKKDFLNYCYEIKKIDVTVATDYLKETLFCLFDKLDIKQFFQSQIEEFIQGTIDRIEKYKRYGIEDDKIFFEKALRSKKGIVITTAHGVKGEEYRVVISFALLYGFIPHWDTICNHEERRDSESKKLLYVICSRAKEKLFLFAENNRKTSNGFLYEINPQLMKVKEEIENEKE